MATHSSTLAWRIPMDRGSWWATVHRVAKTWTPSPSAGDLRELPRVPLRGEGSCGGGGAPRTQGPSALSEKLCVILEHSRLEGAGRSPKPAPVQGRRPAQSPRLCAHLRRPAAQTSLWPWGWGWARVSH